MGATRVWRWYQTSHLTFGMKWKRGIHRMWNYFFKKNLNSPLRQQQSTSCTDAAHSSVTQSHRCRLDQPQNQWWDFGKTKWILYWYRAKVVLRRKELKLPSSPRPQIKEYAVQSGVKQIPTCSPAATWRCRDTACKRTTLNQGALGYYMMGYCSQKQINTPYTLKCCAKKRTKFRSGIASVDGVDKCDCLKVSKRKSKRCSGAGRVRERWQARPRLQEGFQPQHGGKAGGGGEMRSLQCTSCLKQVFVSGVLVQGEVHHFRWGHPVGLGGNSSPERWLICAV